MARRPAVEPYPWQALERTDRRTERAARGARRALSELRPEAIAARLTELIGTEVAIQVRRLDAREPPETLVRVGIAFEPASAVVVGAEPALVVDLLSRLLKRKIPLVHPEMQLEPALHGAFAALLIEAVRASGTESPPRLLPVSMTPSGMLATLTLSVAGRPYLGAVWLPSDWTGTPRDRDRTLRALGSLPIALPLVVAESLASPAALRGLKPGAAWCPGPGWWIDRDLRGSAVLVGPEREQGQRVELLEGGKIVLREPQTVALATAEASAMDEDDGSEPTTLAQAALEAPLVVRVELGSVSMPARAWADLRPGDVIETGRHVGEPVLLRVGGRVLARGELVNVEGELGVRVTEIYPEASS